MFARPQVGTMHPVDTSAYRGPVHVRVDGPDDGAADAPVLVLLHGFTSSLQWFDLVVRRLRDTCRLVRVDLVGHASTGGPALDAPGQTEVMAALLDQLGLDDVVAVGHSFGADIAVGLAESSSRVGRVAILAQAPDYSDATLPVGSAIMTPRLLGRLLHRGAVPVAMSLGAVVGRGWPSRRVLVGQAVADFRAMDPGMFRIVIRDRRERLAARPLDVQLRAAGKPALVILGEKDHFYGARCAQRYRDAGARVEVLADSGHSPIIDCPQETASLLCAFATRSRREPAG